MFGGLELKGNDSKESDAGSTSAATPPPAPAASGFGFMNATAPAALEEPAPAPMEAPAPAAAAASSGFSFLNPEPAAPEPAPTPPAEPAPAPAVSSGFDFLMSTTATTPAPAPELATAPEPAPPTEAASAFSFLMSTTAMDTPTAPEPEPVPAPEPAPAASSGFDFLMSTTTTTPAPAPEPVEKEEIPAPMNLTSSTPSASISSLGSASASAAAAPSLMDMTTPPAASIPSALPTGAGVSFGVAAKRGGVKKKKTRAARVGMGSAAVTPASPPKRPQPAPAPAPEPVERKVSARDEAEEATKRAEEFMSKKVVEEASKKVDPPEITAAPSTDSVLQAAEKAAKEAKVLSRQQQQSQQKQKSGFMGTFFKGFGGQAAPPINKRGSSSSVKSNSSVDRLANKQKDMKRAMAEREIQLQKQSQQSKPKEPTPKQEKVDLDDYVAEKKEEEEEKDAVSTSVPSYSPETTPASSDSNPISSHFEPAKPPSIVVQELKPKPAPRKSKTGGEIFEEYEALFAQSVHKAMEQVENVRSTQKMLLEERFVAMAKLNLSEQQINQVEAQLQVAVEEEDYELADQLGQVAEAHKREKEEVSMMLDANFKALEHLDSQKHLVVQGVATCFSNLAVRLKELKGKESSKDHSNDSETFRQFEVISKQLSVEKERLQQDAKHLERDEQLVAEERKDLEVAISEQSGVLEQQRDDVKEKLEGVEAEIEEMRKQLEEKQKIAAGLRTEMHGFEDSIDKVRVKFSRQLNRVDKKELALQENRREFEAEEKAYERQKEAHEMQVQSHSEAMLAHDSLMKELESELTLTKEFAEMIPEKVGFLEESPKGEKSDENEEGDLASLQADVVKCEAAASEAKIVLKAASATIVNLESELAVLAAKIPQLEATKKSAAASRDFKAASKASKEIKDATARMKECQEELVGEAANRKAAAEEEAVRLDAELEKTRKVADEREKVSAQTKMAALAKKIEQLKAIQSKMCGDSTSSQNSVRGVGALVLEGQINSLKAEGESLGQKYGGWKKLIGEGEDVADTNGESPEEAATGAKPTVDDGLTSRERILKVRELLKRISDAEESLEAAAAREDFDEAAELHDVFQNLQSELEKIDLTEEEMEIAMGDGELPPEEEVAEEAIEQGEAEETEPVVEETESVVDDEGAVEEKKEEEATEEEVGNADEVEAEPKEESKPEVVASDSLDEEQMLQDEEATLDA